MNTQKKNIWKQTPRFFSRRLLTPLFCCALGVSALAVILPFGIAHWEMSHAQTRTQTSLYRLSSSTASTMQPVNILSQQASDQGSSLATLVPALSSYLAGYGQNVGVEVYDVTHQRYYGLNNTNVFLTASSVKVPIMLTLLALTESQGRAPTANELGLLTAMIENSDNDAASALFSEINGASGIDTFLQQNGLSGLTPDQDAWGYSQITPQAMVNLLTRLNNGTILNATDRATALSLMEQVESDQQWGVGNTAPAGATFAMKNGWVPGPDGLWSVNTSGIVQANGVTYIISVYTQEQPSLAAGQALVQQVCGDVASALS